MTGRTGPDGSRTEAVPTDDAATDDASWCPQCGEALDVGGHDACGRRAALEPPRWCGRCRRRMVVQVTPDGWSATCSRHGTEQRSTWG